MLPVCRELLGICRHTLGTTSNLRQIRPTTK